MKLLIKRIQLGVTKFFKGFGINSVNRDLRIMGVLVFILLILLVITQFGGSDPDTYKDFESGDDYNVTYNDTRGTYYVEVFNTDDPEAKVEEIRNMLLESGVNPDDILISVPGVFSGKDPSEEQYIDPEIIEQQQQEYEQRQEIFYNGPEEYHE